MVAAGLPSPLDDRRPALEKKMVVIIRKNVGEEKENLLWTDDTHVFTISDAQKVQMFEQSQSVGHLQGQKFCKIMEMEKSVLSKLNFWANKSSWSDEALDRMITPAKWSFWHEIFQ
jgi:hypothetical protein